MLPPAEMTGWLKQTRKIPMLATPTDPPPSPLMLCDHLLSLAEEAARAGLKRPAGTLLRLALRVLENTPPPSA